MMMRCDRCGRRESEQSHPTFPIGLCGTCNGPMKESIEYRYHVVAVGILVFIFAAAIAVKSLWNQWIYGDWTCAFKRCVQISDVKK